MTFFSFKAAMQTEPPLIKCASHIPQTFSRTKAEADEDTAGAPPHPHPHSPSPPSRLAPEGCALKQIWEKRSLIDAPTRSNRRFKGQTTSAACVISLITDINKQWDRAHMFGVCPGLLHLSPSDCCTVGPQKHRRGAGKWKDGYWSVLKNTTGEKRR